MDDHVDVLLGGAARFVESVRQRIDHLRHGLLGHAAVVELDFDHGQGGAPLSWLNPILRRRYGRRMMMRLQHCGLVVSDLERSRHFYGAALGLEELQRPSSFTFAGAWFALGDTEIHLLA